MKRSMLENMPRVLFVLVPVFALIVNLFYRRFKYPAHLYFSIHLHTLVFMVLAVAELAKFTHAFYFSTGVMIAAQLASVAYAFVSLRGMYGGRVPITLAKGVGIGVLYGALWACANFGLA